MKDWIIHYVETKDVFTKKLKKYDIKDDIIEFDFGNHNHFYLFQKDLNQEIVGKAKKFDKKTIVCEKNEKNFDFLINNFEDLASISKLILIFLDKNKSRKLLLNPQAHHRISDPKTLKQGIKSLWDNS